MSAIRCRAWFDYVNTKDNLADPLSRDGYGDPRVARRLRRWEWLPVSETVPWPELLRLGPQDLWQLCSALGLSESGQ